VKVFKLAAGVAVGYVLGSRAGRARYEQIVAAARKAQSHPAVTQVQQAMRQRLGTPTASGESVLADTPPTVVADAPARHRTRNAPKTATAIVEPPA
jgi:hypothetical protein